MNPRVTRHFAMGMATALLPIAYVVQQHVSWESSPQSKKRMLTHHATFWSAFGAGLLLLHTAFFNKDASTTRKTIQALAGGLLAASGFKLGGKLGELLFPHQPKPENIPEPSPSPLVGEGGRRPDEGWPAGSHSRVPVSSPSPQPPPTRGGGVAASNVTTNPFSTPTLSLRAPIGA